MRVTAHGVSRACEPLRDPRVRECPFFRAHEGSPAGEARAPARRLVKRAQYESRR